MRKKRLLKIALPVISTCTALTIAASMMISSSATMSANFGSRNFGDISSGCENSGDSRSNVTFKTLFVTDNRSDRMTWKMDFKRKVEKPGDGNPCPDGGLWCSAQFLPDWASMTNNVCYLADDGRRPDGAPSSGGSIPGCAVGRMTVEAGNHESCDFGWDGTNADARN